MTYEWKMPGIVPVDAQTAGDEFSRIYAKNGKLDAESVVEESRAESAPLHPCFEWDDIEAAKEYRKTQAMTMLRMITIKAQAQGIDDPVSVRAFVSTKQSAYQPLSVVLSVPDLREEMLNTALKELTAFQAKYSVLEALKPVFDAAKEVKANAAQI